MTTTRNQRLYVRADAEEKARIEFAAHLARLNVSDFIRLAVEERAEAVISDRTHTVLSPDDFDAVAEALERPAKASTRLQKAAASGAIPFVQK
jgi:uncharacterized protein (DUF1778 family)